MKQSAIALTREELYHAIWKTPMHHLCKTWSISVYRLSKICEQFDIPRPGADYWPLLRLNRAMEYTPLPPAVPNQPSMIHIISHTARRPAKLSPQQIQPGMVTGNNESASSSNNPAMPNPNPVMQVAQDFRKAHPLIRTSRELLEKETPDSYGRVGPCWRRRCVNVSVTKQNLRRALLILDAIFQALESKGHKVEVIEDRYERFETEVAIGAEKVSVKMLERTIRRERNLTEKEKAERYVWNRYFYEPTGILNFSIEEFHCPTQKMWADKKRQPIENVLSEIIDAIVATGESLRLYRIEEAERQRREAERARREYELQQLREQELNRRRSLEQQAARSDKADQLRTFIAACEVRLANGGTLGQDSPANRWLDWARRCAEELDPLNGDYLHHAIQSLPDHIIKLVVKE